MDGIESFERLIKDQEIAEMTNQKINELRHLLVSKVYDGCELLIREIGQIINQHYDDIRHNVDIGKFFLSCGDYYSNLDEERIALKYYHQCHYEKYRIKTPYDGKEVNLLSFRKISTYVLSDLINSEITLSNPLLMNDPFDSIALLWSNQNNWNRFASGVRNNHEYYAAAFKKYRIRSFTRNKITSRKNNLMWAHYADDHKGFCIEYCLMPEIHNTHNIVDLSFSVLQNVNYDKNNDDVLKNRSLSTSDAFASKDKVWNYENEVRLLFFNPNFQKDFETIPLGKSYISAIYFGFKCPEENIRLIKKILGDKIKYYQMKQAKGKIYSLEPTEI